MAIPVYVFTGFLDSGKTRFMQGTLEDDRFNAGEKTLLLVCEEGEEEYDPSAFAAPNVYIEVIEDQDALDDKALEALRKKHHAERVCVELNGMKLVSDFYAKMPKNWVVYQEIMFADATTFVMYNANMRSLVVDKVGGCEMIVFNRYNDSIDKMELHKIVRGINRRCDIAYEDEDGKVEYDEIEDPLPFDLSADIIDIKDDDYGIWYRDVTEDMQKYSGKTVRFKAQVAHTKKVEKGCFVPGRFIMTCCVEDIQFGGLVAKYKDAQSLEHGGWVDMTAKIEREYNDMYQSEGPVFHVISVTKVPPIADEVATFY